MSGMLPRVVFASPRKLPRPSDLDGRVVVLDIAGWGRVGSEIEAMQC